MIEAANQEPCGKPGSERGAAAGAPSVGMRLLAGASRLHRAGMRFARVRGRARAALALGLAERRGNRV